MGPTPLNWVATFMLMIYLLCALPASAKSVGMCYMSVPTGCDGLNECNEFVDSPLKADTGVGEVFSSSGGATGYGNCKAGNYIQLDCNSSLTSGPYESTADTITIDVFHNGPDKYLRPSWSGKVGCDAITDHTFHFIYPGEYPVDYLSSPIYDHEDLEVADPRAKGMSVVLSTNGHDAFRIDELYLRTHDSGPDSVIAHWGKEGGKGYCLSTDPSDATGSWDGEVDGCHKEIKFVVSGCDYDLDDDDGCQDVWHTKIAPGYQLGNPYGLKGYTTGSGTAWKNVNSVYACSAKAKKEGHLYFTWYSKGEYAERALCKTWNNPGIHWKQSTRDVEMRHYARTKKGQKAFKKAQ